MANVVFAVLFMAGVMANSKPSVEQAPADPKPAVPAAVIETPKPAGDLIAARTDTGSGKFLTATARVDCVIKTDASENNVSFGVAELGTADARLLDPGTDANAPILAACGRYGSL